MAIGIHLCWRLTTRTSHRVAVRLQPPFRSPSLTCAPPWLNGIPFNQWFLSMDETMHNSETPVRWLPYIAMSTLALAAILLALYSRGMAGVVLYDSNFEAFHDVLSEEQGTAIIRASRTCVSLPTSLLILTNTLWVVGTGVGLWRRRRNMGVGKQ